jgi:hypothetical protein
MASNFDQSNNENAFGGGAGTNQYDQDHFMGAKQIPQNDRAQPDDLNENLPEQRRDYQR